MFMFMFMLLHRRLFDVNISIYVFYVVHVE